MGEEARDEGVKQNWIFWRACMRVNDCLMCVCVVNAACACESIGFLRILHICFILIVMNDTRENRKCPVIWMWWIVAHSTTETAIFHLMNAIRNVLYWNTLNALICLFLWIPQWIPRNYVYWACKSMCMCGRMLCTVHNTQTLTFQYDLLIFLKYTLHTSACAFIPSLSCCLVHEKRTCGVCLCVFFLSYCF